MAFLGNLFGNKNTPPPVSNNSNNMSLDLTKEQALTQLDLRKKEVQSLCLTKAPLNNAVSRVCVAMDYSGSMSRLYRSGFVQAVLERLLPIAMQFDDNGEMEVWLFDTICRRVTPISLSNFYNYINNENFLSRYHMGGTNYAPVIKDIYQKYIVEEPANVPTLVLFMTDGNNADATATTAFMKETSHYPIFWQFVGIGDAQFTYLQKLDDLQGRFVDNANFFAVNDLNRISDNELYKRLLAEYPTWLTDIRNKGMI